MLQRSTSKPGGCQHSHQVRNRGTTSHREPTFVCFVSCYTKLGVRVCVQGRAVVPEGHVFMAPAACEHEERGVVELPAERHQDRLWMEPGHGELHSFFVFCNFLLQFHVVLTAHLPSVRYAASLLRSGNRPWVTWTLIWPTSWPTARRAVCSRPLRGGKWRKTCSRHSDTARTCCSTWRPVRRGG